MYPKIEHLTEEYKDFQELKKTNKGFTDGFILFNQQILTECGGIHEACLNHWDTGGKEEYKKFITDTFPGLFYNDWRKARAVSCAEMVSISARLGVHWKDGEIIGETFYAGIPPVTMEEIKAAALNTKESEEYQKEVFSQSEKLPFRSLTKLDCLFIACSEKIGVDGIYRPVDKYGDFEHYPYNPEDVYGDGTNVTSLSLNLSLEKHDEQSQL